MANGKTWNILMVGVGGQGIVTSSDILTRAAMEAGHDAKKSEIHGMSQRGGSVASDVRFGRQVLSPMVPPGEADFLLLVDPGQLEINRNLLRPVGILIHPGLIDPAALASRRSLNVALVGALSAWLGIPEQDWMAAIRASLREHLHEANLAAFETGRAAVLKQSNGAWR